MNVLHYKISYKLIQIYFLFFFSISDYPDKKLLNHEYQKVFLYAKIKINCTIVEEKKKSQESQILLLTLLLTSKLLSLYVPQFSIYKLTKLK